MRGGDGYTIKQLRGVPNFAVLGTCKRQKLLNYSGNFTRHLPGVLQDNCT